MSNDLFAYLYNVIEMENLSEGYYHQTDEVNVLSGEILVSRYPNSRFFQVTANGALLGVCVYKRGAMEIKRVLDFLKNRLKTCEATSSPTQAVA